MSTSALVVAISAALQSAPSAQPMSGEARRLVQQGVDAYDAGQFEAAIEHYRRAFAIDDNPAILYAWAQAERMAGDCAEAVELYRRYLASDPEAAQKEAAQTHIAQCEGVLAESSVEPGPVAGVPAPVPAVSAPNPRPPEPATTAPDVVRKPPDRITIALAASGGVLLGAGVAILGVLGGSLRAQSQTHDYLRFDDLERRVVPLAVSGSIVTAVGLGLVTGAIVHRVRSKRRAALARRAR